MNSCDVSQTRRQYRVITGRVVIGSRWYHRNPRIFLKPEGGYRIYHPSYVLTQGCSFWETCFPGRKTSKPSYRRSKIWLVCLYVFSSIQFNNLFEVKRNAGQVKFEKWGISLEVLVGYDEISAKFWLRHATCLEQWRARKNVWLIVVDKLYLKSTAIFIFLPT